MKRISLAASEEDDPGAYTARSQPLRILLKDASEPVAISILALNASERWKDSVALSIDPCDVTIIEEEQGQKKETKRILRIEASLAKLQYQLAKSDNRLAELQAEEPPVSSAKMAELKSEALKHRERFKKHDVVEYYRTIQKFELSDQKVPEALVLRYRSNCMLFGYVTPSALNLKSVPLPYVAWKIGVTGHTFVLLWDKAANLLEIFDPSGLGPIGKGRAIANMAIECLFPKRTTRNRPTIVSVNRKNLQTEDNLCQAWTFYYICNRVIKRQPYKSIIQRLLTLHPPERFHKVAAFWHQLINE